MLSLGAFAVFGERPEQWSVQVLANASRVEVSENAWHRFEQHLSPLFVSFLRYAQVPVSICALKLANFGAVSKEIAP